LQFDGNVLSVIATGGSTSAPNTALIVDYESGGALTTGGGTAIELRGNSSGGGIANYQQARIRSIAQPTNNAHGLAFDYKPNAGTALTEVMRIDTNGNVGIWTTSPAYKLDVNGAIRAQSSSYMIGEGYGIYGNADSTNYIIKDSSGTLINNWYGGHIFQTLGGTERMRLNYNGTLCVNTTSDTSGMNGTAKLAIGQMGIKTMSAGYQVTLDTGIPVNQGANGGTLMLMVSGHTSDQFSTQSALYLIQFPYNGDYTPNKIYIAGQSDFVTVGTTGSAGNKTLTLYCNSIPTYTFFMCT
jgi:hypothetical protein